MKYAKFIIPLSLILLVLGSCSKEKKELTSNSWRAESIKESTNTARENAPPNSNYLLKFDDNSQMTLKLDVNNCTANVMTDKGKFQISEGLPCTKYCCDSKFAQNLAHLFSEVSSYKITGQTLTFKGKNGLELVFKQN